MGARDRDLEIFRREALEHRARARGHGDLLRMSPGWMRSSFWVLLLVMAVTAGYVALGRIDDYATGKAFILDRGRVEVSAETAGVVAAVDVRPGQEVAAGQVLVRLGAGGARPERALARLAADQATTSGCAAAHDVCADLLVELAAEEARRTVRAPKAGRVAEIYLRTGQSVAPGAIVAEIAGTPDFAVVALLPGRQRPHLRRGMPMRVELAGHASAYRTVTIDELGDRLLGPAEAARAVGRGDAPVGESFVLVRAQLGASDPEERGEVFDGTSGTARVRVGSRSVLLTIFPGLEQLLSSR